MGRVTLLDIAAETGVSRATVSLVLHDSPRVSEATKQRVRKAMTRLGYVYDRRAADLRGQRSMTIGLVVTQVQNPFFAELVMNAEQRLEQAGYTLVTGYSRDDLVRQERLLTTMVERRVDGVLVLPAHASTPDDLTLALDKRAVPHVVVARAIPGYDADYVGVDYVRGARELVGHLLEEGHRRIALLGGFADTVPHIDRVSGLEQGMRAPGATEPALVIPSTADSSGGVAAARQLLEEHDLPDAVVCYSDLVATGVLSVLRATGVEPGGDVAVASFDDSDAAALQTPPLTSVATHPDRVGDAAAQALIARIADGSAPVSSTVLPPTLRVRTSSRRATP